MKLIDEYQKTGFIKAGELLLTPTHALDFIKEIESRDILILGVNLWCYFNDQIAEDPGSLDLSEIDDIAIPNLMKYTPPALSRTLPLVRGGLGRGNFVSN
ncbi:hypothetical protein H6G54_10810 [Anabaena cylindrica FACHB-243]|uniref:Uncharacterized protein n=2 Tax=Anabaena TaxID=1163 RepID=K9ZAY5_ANACC|nr:MULTISPECIES: hypothetical protein [Anabaena]AFZ56363.1 hypothetical protein Anacy_0780 [Anabaena cylindrica PCC 7122]MBD2418188.1 hypothetical protein [Anabaena cylindrica FACHB-243]MCM2409090.1 hypothetical protein [Anabaena sp. CCAP 1446/1C]BAY01195.1 hypothetical protein NIES19_04250 [Anabaena cylindrica PCC 7122]